MPIQVSCSSCGDQFKAPDDAAGKRTKCPTCGTPIEIPTPLASEEILEAEPDLPPQFSDEDFEVEPPPELPQTDQRKPCPMCGEMIQADAVKCRYCGEIFDPVLKKKQKKARDLDEDADLSTADWALAVLCSGIGCILGIIWIIQGKPKGKKMLLASILMNFFWGAVRAVIEMIAEANL